MVARTSTKTRSHMRSRSFGQTLSSKALWLARERTEGYTEPSQVFVLWCLEYFCQNHLPCEDTKLQCSQLCWKKCRQPQRPGNPPGHMLYKVCLVFSLICKAEIPYRKPRLELPTDWVHHSTLALPSLRNTSLTPHHLLQQWTGSSLWTAQLNSWKKSTLFLWAWGHTVHELNLDNTHGMQKKYFVQLPTSASPIRTAGKHSQDSYSMLFGRQQLYLWGLHKVFQNDFFFSPLK